MSQRKARVARKPASQNGTAPTESEVPADAPDAPQPMQHPGVLVMRVPVPSNPGQEEIQLLEINGLDPLCVPTLLRKAASIREQNLGL